MAYTSDDLVTDIQRDSYMPAAQRDFTPATILGIADQELIETIAPALVANDDGFFLEAFDTTLAASTSDYQLSRYAMWGKLRLVEIIDSGGNPRHLSRVTTEQAQLENTTSSGAPQSFMMLDTQVRLYPTPADATETLRQWFYRRPNRLIATASAAQVSTVVGGVVTYTGTLPSGYTSSSVHDFYSGNSPFRRIGTAKTATAAGGSTQTFAAADAALLSAGDWVCPQDQTVFPAIPIELHPFLKDLVIRSIARTQMDAAAYQTARQEIQDRMLAVLKSGPGARIVGQPKKLSLPFERVYGRRRRWFR